jgi:hypothetical protein
MMTMQSDTLQSVLEMSMQRLETSARSMANERGIAARGRAVAETSKESVFADAMLTALHSRFAEYKEVTK